MLDFASCMCNSSSGRTVWHQVFFDSRMLFPVWKALVYRGSQVSAKAARPFDSAPGGSGAPAPAVSAKLYSCLLSESLESHTKLYAGNHHVVYKGVERRIEYELDSRRHGHVRGQKQSPVGLDSRLVTLPGPGNNIPDGLRPHHAKSNLASNLHAEVLKGSC
jgi:hypothetical protein